MWSVGNSSRCIRRSSRQREGCPLCREREGERASTSTMTTLRHYYYYYSLSWSS